ncbi:Catechol 2,3-dioxygenase [Cyclobacterium xiamenense]|uniref:Catechol 2,3-dioxygenase n=1 Tax=Cyclobacterium xiamenense TaxID=1297121 RepID=A0A1H6TQK6_9BACT|nr:VOC family protein [Cyclobacterium xiamenense]SEI78485.1 Catechol 2,3-dioxygenase [Cyclobacterium xiamenense]
MKIEHLAINVTNPQAVSDWYEKNLGLTVVKKMDEAPYMTFLADDSGKVMIELYQNSKASVLEFAKLDPLMLHLAFVSEDPEQEKSRLVAAGAVLVSDDTLADGTRLLMLRDPWGLAIQFCKRAKPMLK